MRILFAAFFLFATMGLATQASADNSLTTIVLHAMDTAFAPCAPVPIDCAADSRPAIDVTGMASPAIYVMLRNYEEVVGLQCAFDAPGWVFTFGLWDCRTNQVNGYTPTMPLGATNGTITTAFDVLTGGALAVIGRMNFVAPSSGCLSIIESSFPFATHVINSLGQDTPVVEANRGKVCVGSGGYDSCDPVTPVEPATWGNIKAQYQR